MAKYYFQIGSDAFIDIKETWNIDVLKVDGLIPTSKTKSVFTEDWKDEQGLDVYMDSKRVFNDRKLTLTLRAVDRDDTRSFFAAISSIGEFQYYDTYRNMGCRMYFDSESTKKEKYRQSQDDIQFNCVFIVPNGISFGVGGDLVGGSISLSSSTPANLYFSDGSSHLDWSGSLVKDITDGFVVIEPDSVRGVSYNVPIISSPTKNRLKKGHYFQFDTDSFIDIYDEYGVFVIKNKGLEPMPSSKTPFDANISTKQGKEVDILDKRVFDERKIVLTIAILNEELTQIRLLELLRNIMDASEFQYYDSWKKQGCRMYFDSAKVRNEKYRNNNDFITIDITFMAPNGLSLGIGSFEGAEELNITVVEESDFYFADGTNLLNYTGIIKKSLDNSFVIINPFSQDSLVFEINTDWIFNEEGVWDNGGVFYFDRIWGVN